MYAPKNIMRFLNNRGVVLLVRGKPGTGKTTFVLGLMEKYNLAYVSTGKIIERIEEEHPWITESMRNRMFSIEGKYQYNTTDHFGQMFYLLPVSLRHVLNLYEEGKIQGIIVDSWHAIVNQLNIMSMEEKERENLYDPDSFFLKLTKFADSGVKFVVVKEGTEDDALAYLADGLITMDRKVEEGRVYRWFEIEKLRGEEIDRHRYYFTLKGSKFHYLESGTFRHPSKLGKYQAVKREDGKLSSVYFDDLLSLSRGSTVLFDFGDYIPMAYRAASIMGIMANFLATGSRVVIVPPNDLDMNEMKYGIYLYGIEQYTGNLSYMYGEKIMEPFSRKVNFSKPVEIVNSVIDELTSNESGAPPLVIVGYDRLHTYLSANDLMHTLYRIKDAVKEKSGVLLIAGNMYDKEIKRFCSSLSDAYIKFHNIDGYVLMYGIKPWTKVYILDLKYSEFPKIEKRVIV